jgi:hypothetical protein
MVLPPSLTAESCWFGRTSPSQRRHHETTTLGSAPTLPGTRCGGTRSVGIIRAPCRDPPQIKDLSTRPPVFYDAYLRLPFVSPHRTPHRERGDAGRLTNVVWTDAFLHRNFRVDARLSSPRPRHHYFPWINSHTHGGLRHAQRCSGNADHRPPGGHASARVAVYGGRQLQRRRTQALHGGGQISVASSLLWPGTDIG